MSALLPLLVAQVLPAPPEDPFGRWNPQPYTMGEWDGDRFQMLTRGWGLSLRAAEC